MSRIKPTAVLKLEKGKLYDVQRDRAALEPQPKRLIRPTCPREFTQAERKAWRTYARRLDNQGMLLDGNAGLLKRLASASILYESLRQSYLDTMNPKVGLVMLRVGKDMDAMEMALGLPSMARAKLGSLMLTALKKRDKFFDD